jgi:predicted RNA binding protein YcfA (HicA-like mRNA interferase family)
MVRKRREVLRGLRRNGFREINARHVQLKYLSVEGEDAEIATLVSHGADRDIGDQLIGQMSRQLHLTRRQFDDLIDCRLSQTDYEAMMRRDGFIR